MKAVIIEDEQLSAERLQHLVKKVAPEIVIVSILNSVSRAQDWFRDHSPPDLIFLDIQLGDGTGFDILQSISGAPLIIFTTAYDEYAIKAFKFNSIDYLLKPVEREALSSALQKLNHTPERPQLTAPIIQATEKIIKNDYKKRFLIKIGEQFQNIDSQNISYFHYEDGACTLSTHEKNLPVDYSLDQLEEILNPIDFFRINRQFIVSSKSISEIHTYFNSRLLLKLSPDFTDDVIVSRDRVNGFKRWLDS